MKTIDSIKEEIKNLESKKEDARVLYMKCEGGVETLEYLLNKLEEETTEKTDKKVGKKTDS